MNIGVRLSCIRFLEWINLIHPLFYSFTLIRVFNNEQKQISKESSGAKDAPNASLLIIWYLQ